MNLSKNEKPASPYQTGILPERNRGAHCPWSASPKDSIAITNLIAPAHAALQTKVIIDVV
jgi:hypothetical protein